MILLITNEEDITTDFVVRELTSNHAPFVRLNTERLGESAFLSFAFPSGTATLRVGERVVALNEVSAVYFRRPVLPRRSEMDDGVRQFAAREYQALLESLYRHVEVPWVNNPLSNRRADSKALQLQRAAGLGLVVPQTLVSNDPSMVRAFLGGKRCVVKVLHQGQATIDGKRHLAFVKDITVGDAADNNVRAAPCIYQERVERVADIRVTVVGRRAFATRIVLPTPAEHVDWREVNDEQVSYEVSHLPAEVERQCVKLVADFGLTFAAIDLSCRMVESTSFLN